MYSLRANKELTTSWIKYSATISGIDINATNATKFRQGTKYVRLVMIRNSNSNNTGTVTTSFTNISIKKV